ncbi:HD-GYP domain-containing protein [Lachnospiraceae bacterium OttesenSCG-928-D06]|nr:HD-GYP domain-containing protein [Lachnospiraceae bacterium OttesenSCG-928-D06]
MRKNERNREMKSDHISLLQTNEVLSLFSHIIGVRDEYTQGHSHHVAVVAEAIARQAAPQLDLSKLVQAALLHDIGKILIPDSILNKEGSLNNEEWEIMRRHPKEGKRLLAGSPLGDMGHIILYHHERMDGKGYYGIKGSEIPLEARIISIADTFSALRTWRIYRPAKDIDTTIAILREAAGTQLDADLVDAFLSLGRETLNNLECQCDICKCMRKNAMSGITQQCFNPDFI